MREFYEKCVLFARTINIASGGMEAHEEEFIKRTLYTITYDNNISLYRNGQLYESGLKEENYKKLLFWIAHIHPDALFLNDLAFITLLPLIKESCKNSIILLRSGGNDIFRAPVGDDNISLQIRQATVRELINSNVDYLIVNSDYSYFRLVEFGIKPEIMKKIRGGVDLKLVNHLKESRNDAREYVSSFFHHRNKCINLIIACRMKKFKGVDKFLEIIIKHQYFDAFNILIVGDGEELEKLQLIANKANYVDNIYFTGEIPHNEVLRLIAGSDYLISSSILEERYFGNEHYTHTETMGRSMIEALMLNIPIIATNVGGTEELFYECKYAGDLLCSIADINDILSKIALEQKHPDILTPDYSWDKVFDDYYNLIWGETLDVLSLDLDDTIIGQNTNISTIREILHSISKQATIVINTARGMTPEHIKLCNYLGADYIIFGNGLSIYGLSKDYIWNNRSYFSQRIIDECDKIFTHLCKVLKSLVIKKTHPHIIHIESPDGITPTIETLIERAIDGTNFICIGCGTKIKIINKYLSKKAAMDYLKTNILAKTSLYAAGNSLNDYILVSTADSKWLSDDLKNMPTNGNIRYFPHEEAGALLLKRIVADMKNGQKQQC